MVVALFSERLKMARKNNGITQDELSRRSGIPKVTISSYERGAREPSLFYAVCLAEALGVSICWLAGVCRGMEEK